MAMKLAEAWEQAKPQLRALGRSAVALDVFRIGFEAGWQAQENRPYFCAFCTFEYQGATDEETLNAIQAHVKACELHPLAIENRALRAELDRSHE